MSTLFGIGIAVLILDTFLLFQLVSKLRQRPGPTFRPPADFYPSIRQLPANPTRPDRQPDRLVATLLFSLLVMALFFFLLLLRPETGETRSGDMPKMENIAP